MKYLQALAAVSLLLIALAVAATDDASANGVLAVPSLGQSIGRDAIAHTQSDVVKVANEKTGGPGARTPGSRQKRNIYKRQNRPVQNQYKPQRKRAQQTYQPQRKKHRRADRRKRRRHAKRRRNTTIYFGYYPYYDPYYYDPYYYDPYYDAPTYYVPPRRSRKFSCTQVRNDLRRRGYHKVRAYDCKGKTYIFYARAAGKSYRIRVNAYSGNIKSRRRI